MVKKLKGLRQKLRIWGETHFHYLLLQYITKETHSGHQICLGCSCTFRGKGNIVYVSVIFGQTIPLSHRELNPGTGKILENLYEDNATSHNCAVVLVVLVILLSSPHLSLRLFPLSRLAGRRKKSERRKSLPEGEENGEDDEDADRRPSFLRSLSKLRGDSLTSRDSQEAERESPEEEMPIKRREPLSGENLQKDCTCSTTMGLACTTCNL